MKKPTKLEDRIRAAALAKIKIRITGRKRNKHGFAVSAPVPTGIADPMVSPITVIALTKEEALQNLLARVRCMNTITLSITVNKR